MFTYYRCTACLLVFLFPIPSELDRYYPSEYYPVPSSLEQLEAEAALEYYKIELVKRFVKSGRVLDIGAGYGPFVYLAHKAGYEVDAIEVNSECCEFITKVVGTRAIAHAHPKEALVDLAPYDVITLWHSLEHIPNWGEVLDAVAGKLRPGGICVIAMPNPDAFQFGIFKHHWAHLDAPRHVQLIPVALLNKEMQSLGFRQMSFTTTDPASIGYNGFGWGMSLKTYFILRPVRFGMYLIGRVLATLLKPIEMTGLRGSCYTVVFRKE